MNVKRPIGLVMIMVCQFVTIVYCLLNLNALSNVISVGGTVFGISDPDYLRLFYIFILLLNLIGLISFYKGVNLFRIIFTVIIIGLIVIRFLQLYIFRLDNIYISRYHNSSDIIIFCIYTLIVSYLLFSKKIKNYFKY